MIVSNEVMNDVTLRTEKSLTIEQEMSCSFKDHFQRLFSGNVRLLWFCNVMPIYSQTLGAHSMPLSDIESYQGKDVCHMQLA